MAKAERLIPAPEAPVAIGTDAKNLDTEFTESALERYILNCAPEELQNLENYLDTYQKTDGLFSLMKKSQGAEKEANKTEWKIAKENLDVDWRTLSPELQTLLDAQPDFGRKKKMEEIRNLAGSAKEKRGYLQEEINRQASEQLKKEKKIEQDKAALAKVKAGISALKMPIAPPSNEITELIDEIAPAKTTKTYPAAQTRAATHTSPAEHRHVTPPRMQKRRSWSQRLAAPLVAIATLFGGAKATEKPRYEGHEKEEPGVADVIREEELPPMPLKSRVKIPEDEAEVFESKKPARVVTKEKIRAAVARKNARAQHEEAMRSTGTVKGMTPKEEAEFATPLAERLKRQTETFEPLDTSAGAAQTGGRSQDLYENLQAMDPTGAGTHIPLREDELRAAAKEARDRVLGKYAEGGTSASRE